MSFGLVLAGGGVRGAYHIGVWKALKEMNIDVCAVSGASIGAINGALFAQGKLDTAMKLWERIALDDIVSLPPELEKCGDLFGIKNILKIAGEAYKNAGLDMKPLEELLGRILDEDKVRSSSVDFGLTAYSLTERRLVTLYKNDIPKGCLIPYLMASACLPGFKAREIGGEKFIDGGMVNNMPVDMMIEKGIDDIITVNVKGIGFYKDFNTAGRNIINIECRRPYTGTMDFDRGGIKKSITEGYLDCKREFGLLFGRECYFKTEEYEDVRSKYGKTVIDGVQWAAKAFGLELLRVVSFEALAGEVMAAYLIREGISASESTDCSRSLISDKRLDDKTLICRLVKVLDGGGFDFVKSKLDVLGRNYEAASAILYLKRRIS